MSFHEHIRLHSSRITLGTRCLAPALETAGLDDYSSLFLISQEPVWQHHGHHVLDALAAAGAIRPAVNLVPDGEAVKNLETFGQLLTWLAERGADRKSLLLVVGGGVVGDLSGFVASAYMRGIDWLFIPTTLLAQQDASVGGKVAVNLALGKNLAGHFWEPRQVMIDSHFLNTLPPRHLNAGYMELLKHGVLRGPALYRRICEMPLVIRDWSAHLPLLAEGLRVKVEIVAKDPHEAGERRLLNLGHTLGHALEQHAGYGNLLHGEAVGLGLMFATTLAKRLGKAFDWSALDDAVLSRLPRLDTDRWDPGALLDRTSLDKKGVRGVVTWIIPHEPGKVEMRSDIARTDLDAAMTDFLARLR